MKQNLSKTIFSITKAKDNVSKIVKGIIDLQMLLESFRHFTRTYRASNVEIDMRAMYHPTITEAF
ncbi:hypothetical protein AEM51_04910 [Bacteroidetes bacterium UKL13-3]|jgi:hypothetical protein|nr:hypothetical protein AEM51_04910 [Bacteroidetes bacterium UKL13-3]HCP94905.1 hypothetical protein [Bacteroidota bacterium]